MSFDKIFDRKAGFHLYFCPERQGGAFKTWDISDIRISYLFPKIPKTNQNEGHLLRTVVSKHTPIWSVEHGKNAQLYDIINRINIDQRCPKIIHDVILESEKHNNQTPDVTTTAISQSLSSHCCEHVWTLMIHHKSYSNSIHRNTISRHRHSQYITALLIKFDLSACITRCPSHRWKIFLPFPFDSARQSLWS